MRLILSGRPSNGMTSPLTDTPMRQLAGLNAVDWLLLLVLVWSTIRGLIRGLIREVFGLVGVVLGLILAAWNYLAFAHWLSRWITSLVTAELTAFLLIAMGVLVICTLLGRLVHGTAHGIGLGFPDRLAGAAFGLIRGTLIGVFILITATAFFPPQAAISRSRLAPYFLAAAREVCFVVPQHLQRRITGGIAGVKHIAGR